jgi:hypothetical protein
MRTKSAGGATAQQARRPFAVEILAAILVCIGLFLLGMSAVFGAVAVYLTAVGAPASLQAAPLGPAAVALAAGIYHLVIAIAFRRVKPWSYSHVRFLVKWGSLYGIPGTRFLIGRADVRRALGLEGESNELDPKSPDREHD